MSDLAPMALAEINAIIRLASDNEKLAAQCAGREDARGARDPSSLNYN